MTSPARLDLPPETLQRLRNDHDRFAVGGLPANLEDYLLEAYGLDVQSRYAGLPIRNPWGVASGQLSMRSNQIEAAADAGLGFVVLKTVIAQDAHGDRAMEAWALKESRMVVEPIVGKTSGEAGWTVTWKGRGWWQTFEEYLDLVRESVDIGVRRKILIAPSVKYHLPAREDEPWREDEYATTTRAILGAFQSSCPHSPMPLEKDFSPTLAGSERSQRRAMILGWLDRVPGLIRSAVPSSSVRVGLKLFNSLEDDAFQLSMLARVHGPNRPDFLTYANRLFDPDREFDGQRGVAYGGPDLSDRNLRLLSMHRREAASGAVAGPPLEISGTGDIHSGRMAIRYALRGCSSFQMHTLFQQPLEAFAMKRGERLERALHRLYFDPEEGFAAWLLHVAARLGLGSDGVVRLLDVARLGAESDLGGRDLDA